MQVNNMLTVKFMFCPSKANLQRLKSISCNRNEPKQCINTRQITEVSDSMRRPADNSGNQEFLSCRSMTDKNLPKHDLTAQLYLKFLLITQHEVPLVNMSEATKKVE